MDPHVQAQRRFLVEDPTLLKGRVGDLIIQGYLFSRDGYVIRIRRMHVRTDSGGVIEQPAVLAAKGPRTSGSRTLYEMEISAELAGEFLRRTSSKVVKARYRLLDSRVRWSIDVFHSANEGLMVAECESGSLGSAPPPSWCVTEITNDRRYDNESLAFHPYADWRQKRS